MTVCGIESRMGVVHAIRNSADESRRPSGGFAATDCSASAIDVDFWGGVSSISAMQRFFSASISSSKGEAAVGRLLGRITAAALVEMVRRTSASRRVPASEDSESKITVCPGRSFSSPLTVVPSASVTSPCNG